MRLLMLSPTLPWPLNAGDKIRIYHVLKELSYSHEVTFVSPVHQDSEKEGVDILKQFCSRIHVIQAHTRPRWQVALKVLFSLQTYRVAKFHERTVSRLVAKLLRSHTYDAVWVHFLNTCSYLPTISADGPLIILDQHNADELEWSSFARQGNWAVRFFAIQNLWKLRRFQHKALEQVNVILSVSEEDAVFMKGKVHSSCQVWTVPNGVDTGYFQYPRSALPRGNVIMFCGSMDVTMNVDAVTRFANDIFPLVRKHIPDAEFWIVGRNPGSEVRRLADIDGIRITGTVEDVRPYYEKARLAVAPFRYGGGTKLKVLEAMASGVPLVATKVGAQGIEAVSGQHLFVEERNEPFAQRVIELLRDDGLWESVSLSGRRLVEDVYSWTIIIRDASKRLERLVDNRHEA